MRTDRALRRGQLRRQVLDLVQRHGAGVRLPPERELSEQFGVARETLRRCLDELQSEGLVERRQGAGTFVAGAPWVKAFTLRSFSEDMRSRGLQPSSRLLLSQAAQANAKLAHKFRLSPGAPLIEVRRLRLADDEPMALERTYLAQERVPGLDPSRLATESLYALMASEYGIRVRSASQEIHATVLTEEEAGWLNVAPFSPALLVERTVQASGGETLEYCKSLYRADRYRFEVQVMRNADDAAAEGTADA
jgi:GntR family transcriptional regulator